jgi:hypothetical protein
MLHQIARELTQILVGKASQAKPRCCDLIRFGELRL